MDLRGTQTSRANLRALLLALLLSGLLAAAASPAGALPRRGVPGAIGLYPAVQWHVQGAQQAELEGVYCPHGGYCVAVGSAGNANSTVPLVLVETGAFYHGMASWAESEPKLPPGSTPSTGNALVSVACRAPQSCFAVGQVKQGSEMLPLVETGRDTGGWKPGPTVGLPANHSVAPVHASLTAVSCISSGCLALGSYWDSNEEPQAMAVLLSGSWGTAVNAAPGSVLRLLDAVEVAPPRGAEAGTGANLTGVSCLSSACLAVGDYTNAHDNQEGMSAIFAGGIFSSLETVPAPAGSAGISTTLSGVSCLFNAGHGTTCLASGYYVASSNELATPMMATFVASGTTETWQPSAQVALPSNGSGSGQLNSVSCLPPGDCAAVGTYQTPSGSDALFYDEVPNRWLSVVPEPLSPQQAVTGAVSLESIDCAATDNCAAVGEVTDNGARPQAIEAVSGASTPS
ncbi:MAG TPA: hypothetical protein VME20_00030 [Acidimicrobiales bacterium]|nr:hypothetical protein [Acidimicrobiales bacterium]